MGGQPGRPRAPRADGPRRRHRDARRWWCSTSTRARPAIAECAEVGAVDPRGARRDRPRRRAPKTSGSKGLQLYVPLNTPHTHEHASSLRARRRPGAREGRTPKRIVTTHGQGGSQGQGASSTGARTAATRRRSAPTRCGPGRSPTVSTPVDLGRGRGGRRRRGPSRSRPTTCWPGSTSTATSSPTRSPSNSGFLSVGELARGRIVRAGRSAALAGGCEAPGTDPSGVPGTSLVWRLPPGLRRLAVSPTRWFAHQQGSWRPRFLTVRRGRSGWGSVLPVVL